MMLAAHPKASEMSKSLFNLKELLLVCFFLNIGLSEAPTLDGAIMAVILLLLLPIKGILYYLIFHLFRYRVRTSLLGTLTLFNYSEFGLIVSGLAYKLGWLPGSFLVAIAMTVSISFLIAAPLNSIGHRLYNDTSKWLKEYDADLLNPSDKLIDFGQAHVLILGMGRIGSGAYDELVERYGNQIIGIETREESVDDHLQVGRNVLHGDATDPDFWTRVISSHQIKLVLLAMPNSHANSFAMEQINTLNYKGKVAAIAKYTDEMEELENLGIDAAFNIYHEAGRGFARHVCEELEMDLKPRT